MNISVAMLADFLKKEELITINRFSDNRWFKDVRLYCPGVPVNTDFLYFSAEKNEHLAHLENCSFVYAMEKEMVPSKAFNECLLVLCDKKILFGILQDCFLAYNSWYLDMSMALAEGAGIQKLILLSERIIANPIIVNDVSFRVLAFTHTNNEDLNDEESTFVRKNHYHSPKYIDLLTAHPIFLKNSQKRQGPYLHHYDFLPHPSIYSSLFANKKLSGLLTVIGHYSSLGQGTLDIATLLVPFLEKSLESSIQGTANSRAREKIFWMLLHEKPVEAGVKEYYLKKANFCEIKEHYVAQISFLATAEEVYISPQQLIYLLQKKMPSAIFLLDENGIAVIFCPKETPTTIFNAVLEELGPIHHFIVGVSLPFYGGEILHCYYKQAQKSIFFCKKSKNRPRILYYRQCMLHDILFSYGSKQDKIALLHPALQTIEDYDQKNGTELTHTLQTLLECDNNALIASQNLHIHKNSLYYRLHKISEIAELSLDDPATCEHLRISLHINSILALG